MERKTKPKAEFAEFVDKSIIASFPPGFFQKALATGESFTMQITKNRVILRGSKGRITSWAYSKITGPE